MTLPPIEIMPLLDLVALRAMRCTYHEPTVRACLDQLVAECGPQDHDRRGALGHARTNADLFAVYLDSCGFNGIEANWITGWTEAVDSLCRDYCDCNEAALARANVLELMDHDRVEREQLARCT